MGSSEIGRRWKLLRFQCCRGMQLFILLSIQPSQEAGLAIAAQKCAGKQPWRKHASVSRLPFGTVDTLSHRWVDKCFRCQQWIIVVLPAPKSSDLKQVDSLELPPKISCQCTHVVLIHCQLCIDPLCSVSIKPYQGRAKWSIWLGRIITPQSPRGSSGLHRSPVSDNFCNHYLWNRSTQGDGDGKPAKVIFKRILI